MPEQQKPVRVQIHYDDGTVMTVNSALVMYIASSEKSDAIDITATLVALNDEELRQIIIATVELGSRLGIFQDNDAGKTEGSNDDKT